MQERSIADTSEPFSTPPTGYRLVPPFYRFHEKLSPYRPTSRKMQQSIQTMVAAVVAYLVATYFALPQGYWSVMTAILVVQASIGASLGLAFDRLLATLLGAVVAAALVAIFGHAPGVSVILLAVSVLALSYVATFRGSLRLASVTAAIVILSDPHLGSPMLAAANRVAEIAIGAIIAVATSLLLFPSRAGPALANHVGKTLPLFASHTADSIDAACGVQHPTAELLALNTKVRSALNGANGLVAEARREVTGRVAHHADPAAVVRTLRRLWYTLMMIARAARPVLPAEADPLKDALGNVKSAATAAIQQLGSAYRCEDPIPDLRDLNAAMGEFDAAFAALRRSGNLRPLSTDDAARIFALAFALGQLASNLQDLSDRLDDLSPTFKVG